MFKKAAPLLLLFSSATSYGVHAATNTVAPIANDDAASVIVGLQTTATGDLSANDLYGSIVTLSGTPIGQFGYLTLSDASGGFTYTLYENAATVTNLAPDETATDTFTYTYSNDIGQSATASLTIVIYGNPIDAVNNDNTDDIFENVDIEFNDRSKDATPLNSGRNIKGHLYHPGDKDWYSLYSAGNEIINIELCPQGSSCAGKGSWVLYVFDSDKLTTEMEESVYPLQRWIDDTGEVVAESSSNHMYLAYNAGFFDGALIGIIDPCFGETNSVQIGVGDGPKNYFFAVSSPLKGDAGDQCGVGSVVLKKPGLNVAGVDNEGKPTSLTTTQEYIVAFPYRDDQYAIRVTGTGLDPLLSATAKSSSSRYDSTTGKVLIPKIRIDGRYYQASLNKDPLNPRSGDTSLRFSVDEVNALDPNENADAFQATFDPENRRVVIPRVTVDGSNEAYSAILLYHPETNSSEAWLETLEVKPIE